MKDLALIVPDKDIEQALLGLLARDKALGIRRVSAEVAVHPNRDPGVYHTAHELLAAYKDECGHALVVFDAAWEGAPSTDPSKLEMYVETNCRALWGDRVRCIVIAPEVEIWLWTDSPHVSEALGWPDWRSLKDWLLAEGLWVAPEPKPRDPKLAFERAARKQRIPPSSAVFRRIAEKVSLTHCTDRSFDRLLRSLQAWFPAGSPTTAP